MHLLRDLKGLYDFEPGKQDWASRMAALLIEARPAAAAAGLAGQPALDAAVLDNLVTRYRALAAAGLAANLYRRTATAKDARRIARRFLGFENLILRFATRPDLDIFSNDLASYCTSCGGWTTRGQLINRIKGDIATLTPEERTRVDEAVAVVRKHRAVSLGMPAFARRHHDDTKGPSHDPAKRPHPPGPRRCAPAARPTQRAAASGSSPRSTRPAPAAVRSASPASPAPPC